VKAEKFGHRAMCMSDRPSKSSKSPQVCGVDPPHLLQIPPISLSAGGVKEVRFSFM
jgi:hypothetical protein